MGDRSRTRRGAYPATACVCARRPAFSSQWLHSRPRSCACQPQLSCVSPFRALGCECTVDTGRSFSITTRNRAVAFLGWRRGYTRRQRTVRRQVGRRAWHELPSVLEVQQSPRLCLLSRTGCGLPPPLFSWPLWNRDRSTRTLVVNVPAELAQATLGVALALFSTFWVWSRNHPMSRYSWPSGDVSDCQPKLTHRRNVVSALHGNTELGDFAVLCARTHGACAGSTMVHTVRLRPGRAPCRQCGGCTVGRHRAVAPADFSYCQESKGQAQAHSRVRGWNGHRWEPSSEPNNPTQNRSEL